MMSRPCSSCLELIRTIGIRKVYYSMDTNLDDGHIVENNRKQGRMYETSWMPAVYKESAFVRDDAMRMNPNEHISHGFRFIMGIT